jgi:paraquat-inducible protein B
MRVKTHPRLVGIFVLGAVAIGLAGVLLLTSQDFFAPKERYAVFFPGSVKGLAPGSPVTFRGVQIGEVSQVTPFVTGGEPPVQIEVVLEIRPTDVEAPEGGPNPFRNLAGADLAQALIDRGVRARLLTQSIITGQRYIDLDFMPSERGRFTGLGRQYPELPTSLSSLEKLGEEAGDFLEKLASLPLDQVFSNANAAFARLDTLLASPNLDGFLANAGRSAQALEPTLVELRKTLENVNVVVQRLDSEMQRAGNTTRDTAEDLRKVLIRADSTLQRLEKAFNGVEDTQFQALRTMNDMSRTLEAMRNLLEFLEVHPEAFIAGKPKESK